jgi:hypothetical protein
MGGEMCTGRGGNLKERDHLEDLILGGRIMFKWILKKCDGSVLDKSGSRQGHVTGCCEHSNEPLDSLKCTVD